MVCGEHEILRDGYRRKSYVKSDGTRVKSTYVKPVCIKDLGKPGKGPKVIGKLTRGGLRKFGYDTHSKSSERHIALLKAINKDGYATIVRRVNAIHVLTKNTNPKLSKKLESDLKFVEKLRQ
jgi:uncharacterized protein DUF5771